MSMVNQTPILSTVERIFTWMHLITESNFSTLSVKQCVPTKNFALVKNTTSLNTELYTIQLTTVGIWNIIHTYF